MDLIVIIVVLLGLAVLVFKKIDSFLYYLAIIDIFLRIIDFFANNIPIADFSNFLNSYFPNSVSNIIEIYTSGIFTTVLIWVVVVLYILFLIRIIKTFFNKR